MEILTKKQNYRFWQSGAFGTKLRAWRTYAEWADSGFGGLIAIRNTGVGGGPCLYKVEPRFVYQRVDDLCQAGANREDLMFNEMAPDNAMVLQGEYLNGIREFDGEMVSNVFLHTRVKEQMRDALKTESTTSYGLRSDLLIKEAMSPASYADWQSLLTQYPDHVFEVSIYDHYLGDLPHRNALVWEVRKY
jgi:hypothetical protein